MFFWIGLSDLRSCRLALWFEWPIDVMPRSPVVLSVAEANIIGPPGRLHK